MQPCYPKLTKPFLSAEVHRGGARAVAAGNPCHAQSLSSPLGSFSWERFFPKVGSDFSS